MFPPVNSGQWNKLKEMQLSRQDENVSSIYLTVTEYQICTGLCASFQGPDRLFPIQTKCVSFGKVCTCGTGLFMSILKWCVHNLVFFWFWMCTFILMPIRYFQGYYEVDILYKDPFETNTDWMLVESFIIGVTQIKQHNYGAHWPDLQSIYMTFPFKPILNHKLI